MREFFIKEQSRILTLIHRLMYIISFFTSSFLLIYFLKITNWDLKIISMNYIANYAFIVVGFYFTSMLIKRNNILKIFRLGILTQIVYLSAIMYMAEGIKDYIILLGIVKGFTDSFYWVPRHYMVYTMNKSKAAKKFFSIDQSIAKIQDIIIPVLMGGLIGYTTNGYTVLLMVMIVILVVAFIVSTWLNVGEEEIEPIRMYKIKSFMKNNNIGKVKRMYISEFFNGVTTGGVLVQVVTMLIYLVYKSEFGLGVYNSVLAFVTAIIMFLIGQYLKDEKFEAVLKISGVLTIGVLILLIYKVDYITLVIYSVVTGISFAIINIIGNANMLKLLRKDSIRKYTLENVVLREAVLNAGRIVGYAVFYKLGSLNNNVNSLKFVLLFLSICLSMRLVEMIFALKERDEHTLHAIRVFREHMKVFRFYLKRQI
ncbi:MAG: hypothetical protein A2Y24_05625 [Clostridiales bacterium GWE2_32_10]|nr:MAG: hypothetical protein A2Y24_05625 [Clostridiales bacterium GWE2_32_10]HBY21452.1 hypothetical protein [Clostridiales bacterium]